MKSASVIPRVEATSPPTFTCAPCPNRMPFGLMRKTLPFADRLPRMLDGSGPSTRLRATELLPGCTNWTASVLPMLNDCQLIAAFWLDWLIVVLPGVTAIFAVPADTAPPTGSAWAAEPKASSNEPAIDPRANTACARGDVSLQSLRSMAFQYEKQVEVQKYLTAWIQKRLCSSGAEVATALPTLWAQYAFTTKLLYSAQVRPMPAALSVRLFRPAIQGFLFSVTLPVSTKPM